MATNIDYRLYYAAQSGGHGGNRRVMQLLDFFSRNEFRCKTVLDRLGGGTIADKVADVLRGLVPSAEAPIRRYGSLRGLRRYGLVKNLKRNLAVTANTLYLFDAFVCGYEVLFDSIRKQGGKILVFPHNTDSLSRGVMHPFTGAPAPKWAADEMAALRKADLVCCISREEQWLLSLYGIQAAFLPYDPVLQVRQRLLELRRQRASSTKNCVLILGTAKNLPTFDGMRALLERSGDITQAAGKREVVLLGYGTEKLANIAACNYSSIKIMGGVSDDVLESYLLSANVCLVYQAGTSGMLTRVQELLYCGVPVIANHIAARSFMNAPGVFAAESIDGMIELLEKFQPEDFVPPVPPVALESELLKRIHRLNSQ